MHDVIKTAIWAGTILGIVAILVLAFRKPFTNLIHAHQEVMEAKRDNIQAKQQRELAAALERQNAAELDGRTVEERTELRKAELRRQTAEAAVQTQVAEALTADQVEAERQVMAARTRRRVQAAEDEPVNRPPDSDTMAALAAGYKAYSKKALSSNIKTFDGWLGDIKWTTLDSATMSTVIASYQVYLGAGYSSDPPTLNSWMGERTVRDGVLA